MGRLILAVSSVFLVVAPASADGPLPAPEPLPAGVSWDPWSHDACDPECGDARFAVVAGGPASSRVAAARAARLRGRLAPGYPFLVHTDQIGHFEGRAGVVVIAGAFGSRAEAARYAVAHRGLRVVAIRDPRARGGQDLRQVVEIDRRPARAYRADEVDAILSGRSDRRPTELEPLCTVPAGRAFVIDGWPSLQTWAQVRCGRERAYVRITDTRFQTIVRRVGGETRLSQVVLVECDMATIDTWRWNDEEGRWPIEGQDYFPHPLDGEPGESGVACGG